jgi:hypothetical protein
MAWRVFFTCWILSLGLLGYLTRVVQASPWSPPSFSPAQVTALYFHRTACGWDYPCPPEPGFGRDGTSWRHRRQPGQLYIQNNYGSVTVRVDGSRENAKAEAEGVPQCCEGERHTGDWPSPCGPEPCAPERPREDCGVRCWWKRFRSGYCGHGCWAYREQARAEAEEKEEREERRFEEKMEKEEGKEARGEAWYYPPDSGRHEFEAPPRPRYIPYRDREVPPRYEQPRTDERTPLGRYEGPKYP